MGRKETLFLRHIGLVTLTGILLILISFFFLDERLALFFHELWPSESILMTLFNELSNPNPQVLLWPVIFFIVRYLVGKKEAGEKILTITLSVCLSNMISIPLKVLFGRSRPALFFAEHIDTFDFLSAYTYHLSFPSGHATTIAAVMGALACYYPRHSVALLSASLVLAFARVIATAHFLSDVFAGVLLGTLVAQWVYSTMKKNP